MIVNTKENPSNFNYKWDNLDLLGLDITDLVGYALRAGDRLVRHRRLK